jgi:hypothetical protein
MPGSGESDGVRGESGGNGVHGISRRSTGSGVYGENSGGGFGISGSTNSAGPSIQGDPNVVAAVWGNNSGTGAGVKGTSSNGDGVLGYSGAPNRAGVTAINESNGPSSWGLWAFGTPAGYFQGDVLVTGDLILVNEGGDVAEDFDVEAAPLNAEPGTVLVIHENGNLCASDVPYDTRVAGVVAGAGTLTPAVVLQRVPSRKHRSPIALVGKVFCKVDATFGEVVAGDLLTTSSTPGHAMKASDKSRALGAIVGKALAGLGAGPGLIPILVSPR